MSVRALPVTTTPMSFWESVQDAPVGMAVLKLGCSGEVLTANQTLCRMLGVSEPELVATGLTALTHPDDQAVTDSFHARVRDFGDGQVEKRYRHRDGHYVWMLASAVPLRGADGNPEATLAHFIDVSERKAAEERLAESEWHYRQVVQTTHDGFWAYDQQRRIVSANDRIAQMLGYSGQADVLGNLLDDHLFPEDRAESQARQAQLRNGEQQGSYEVRMRHRDGHEVWAEITPSHFSTLSGSDGGGFAFVREIGDRRAAAQELARSLQLRSLLTANLPNTVAMLFDRDMRYLLVEGSGAQRGLRTKLVGKTVREVEQWLGADMERRYRAALAGETQSFDHCHNDRVFAVTVTPVREDNGEIYAGLVVSRDVTEVRRNSTQLKALAELDTLTGLPNRATFRAELQHALDAETAGVVFFLDLDHFKAVNDSLGHDAGDELLKEISRRITASVRDNDLVARLSGDEFCVLLRDIDCKQVAGRLAQRTLDALAQPVVVSGAEVFISASLGIARLGHDGQDITGMLTAADIAMYAAKGDGRGTYRFFAPEMAERAQARLALSTDLRRAMERGELELHYQPQLRLADGALCSLEALVRWNHRERGMVRPEEFISLAEESGFIVPLGEWVLRTACRQLAQWRERGLDIPKVAVNVSAKQLAHADFPKVVAGAISDSGLAPGQLELEITESALMDPLRCVDALVQLKRIGISIAIDDFGTGYSSLARLRRLPINVLKIDRAFVADADIDADAAMVVRSIISLAHNLGMRALAEGVERQAQRDLLLAEGCDAAAGWIWSRALPASELEQWMQDRHAGPQLRVVA